MATAAETQPAYFASASGFRHWLEKNHATASELLLGFYKKDSGKSGLTYPEAVDELLCFGWIDGVKRRVDESSYTHRITPRRPGSIWSNVNLGHVARLTKAGKMHPAGIKAFEARDTAKTGVYSFEKRPQEFPSALKAIFQSNKQAWTHWQVQPPGYRRVAIHWVISAKHDETRRRRLAQLIAITTKGRRLGGK
jgi:uncharacterized protein YdeI (YjbR/CyaY-like superfamily)